MSNLELPDRVMAPPTLLLSRSLIAQLASPRDYLSAIRKAFAGLAQGQYQLAPVGHLPAKGGAFHLKATVQRAEPMLAAVKINGNFPRNASMHGLPTIQGFVALLDAERGCVLALMDTGELTARRTAAATALAVQCLARADSCVLGIVGCGVQATYHLDALLDVVPIGEVRFCDPRDAAAEAFASRVQRIGLEARRMPSPGAVARGADIVVTLTASTQPLLAAADVDGATFVAGVGADNPSKHELAPDLLRDSRVVVDLLEQAATMGDLHHAIDAGVMARSDIHAELSDVVANKVPGRTADDQRFVFDSTGLAVQDLAAAEMLYTRASARDDVPTIVFDDVSAS